MAAIQKVSHTHEMLLNWLIENPEKSLRMCADHFGYTQAWVSQIIHSDVFQAQLKLRQGEVFSRVAADIPEKLRGLADVAIEKVGEALEKSEDGEFALDVFDKTMHRLGYAPSTARNPGLPQVVQQNNFFIGKEDLAAMRGKMIPAAPLQELTVEQVNDLPAAPQL